MRTSPSQFPNHRLRREGHSRCSFRAQTPEACKCQASRDWMGMAHPSMKWRGCHLRFWLLWEMVPVWLRQLNPVSRWPWRKWGEGTHAPFWCLPWCQPCAQTTSCHIIRWKNWFNPLRTKCKIGEECSVHIASSWQTLECGLLYLLCPVLKPCRNRVQLQSPDSSKLFRNLVPLLSSKYGTQIDTKLPLQIHFVNTRSILSR